MNKLEEIFQQLKKTVPINRVSIALMTVCSLLLIWGGVRACSGPTIPSKSHLFLIARDPSWYPLNLLGKEKTVQAFTSDLILTIAKNRGVRIELKNVSSNYLFEGLNEEEYNAILSSLQPNALNNQYYNFSNPFFFVGPVLIVPEKSNIKTLTGMSDNTIGITRGSELSYNLTKYNAYYKPYDNLTVAFEDLTRDRIDGIILPVLKAYSYIETFHKGKFKVITSPLDDKGLRIVARKSLHSEFLIEEFDKGLQEIIQDGTYQALCDKWGLINPLLKFNDNK